MKKKKTSSACVSKSFLRNSGGNEFWSWSSYLLSPFFELLKGSSPKTRCTWVFIYEFSTKNFCPESLKSSSFNYISRFLDSFWNLLMTMWKKGFILCFFCENFPANKIAIMIIIIIINIIRGLNKEIFLHFFLIIFFSIFLKLDWLHCFFSFFFFLFLLMFYYFTVYCRIFFVLLLKYVRPKWKKKKMYFSSAKTIYNHSFVHKPRFKVNSIKKKEKKKHSHTTNKFKAKNEAKKKQIEIMIIIINKHTSMYLNIWEDAANDGIGLYRKFTFLQWKKH